MYILREIFQKKRNTNETSKKKKVVVRRLAKKRHTSRLTMTLLLNARDYFKTVVRRLEKKT